MELELGFSGPVGLDRLRRALGTTGGNHGIIELTLEGSYDLDCTWIWTGESQSSQVTCSVSAQR